ncbi:MAG: rhomboid family intramembrane serine protease [Nannocystaceae bacterium]
MIFDYRCDAVEPEQSDPRSEPWRARVRAAWVTAGIAAVCVLAFLATVGACAASSESPGRVALESLYGMSSCRATLEGAGALSLARVWVDGEWWRIATTGLLHGSWLHLALNIWSLWSVGEWAERAWGHWRSGALFAVSCLAGSLGSLAWAEAPVVVGASAGILGIAGALLVGRIGGDEGTRTRLAGVSPIGLAITLVVLFAIGAIVPVIAQAGHAGGLLGGTATAWAGMQRGWLRGAVALVLAVGGNGVVHIAARPNARAHYHEFVGFRYIDRGEPELALAPLEQALVLAPEDPAISNAVAYGLALAGSDLPRADGLVDQALAAEPDNPNYLDTKGWIACRRGDVAAGLALLQRASEGAEVPVEEIELHLQTCADADVSRETSP